MLPKAPPALCGLRRGRRLPCLAEVNIPIPTRLCAPCLPEMAEPPVHCWNIRLLRPHKSPRIAAPSAVAPAATPVLQQFTSLTAQGDPRLSLAQGASPSRSAGGGGQGGSAARIYAVQRVLGNYWQQLPPTPSILKVGLTPQPCSAGWTDPRAGVSGYIHFRMGCRQAAKRPAGVVQQHRGWRTRRTSACQGWRLAPISGGAHRAWSVGKVNNSGLWDGCRDIRPARKNKGVVRVSIPASVGRVVPGTGETEEAYSSTLRLWFLGATWACWAGNLMRVQVLAEAGSQSDCGCRAAAGRVASVCWTV